MSNRLIIVLAAIILMAEALAAHADNAGPVKQPAVGTANPAPPAGAAPDLGQQEAPKPVLHGNSTLKTEGTVTGNQAQGPFTGTDTSTAAPGGQAESSANGALSSPPHASAPNDQPAHKTDHRNKPTTDADGDMPK
jgi:hypothetical protein